MKWSRKENRVPQKVSLLLVVILTATDALPSFSETVHGLPATFPQRNSSCTDLGYDYGWTLQGCSNQFNIPISSLHLTRSREGANCKSDSLVEAGNFDLACKDPLRIRNTNGKGYNRDYRIATITPRMAISDTTVMLSGRQGGVIYSGLESGVVYALDAGTSSAISEIEFCFQCPTNAAGGENSSAKDQQQLREMKINRQLVEDNTIVCMGTESDADLFYVPVPVPASTVKAILEISNSEGRRQNALPGDTVSMGDREGLVNPDCTVTFDMNRVLCMGAERNADIFYFSILVPASTVKTILEISDSTGHRPNALPGDTVMIDGKQARVNADCTVTFATKNPTAVPYSGLLDCAGVGFAFGMQMEKCVAGNDIRIEDLHQTSFRSGADRNSCGTSEAVGSLSVLCYSDSGLPTEAVITPAIDTHVMVQGETGGSLYPDLKAGETYSLETGKSGSIRSVEFCFSCQTSGRSTVATTNTGSTSRPTVDPTSVPTFQPTEAPTEAPTTHLPTYHPTSSPSTVPTLSPISSTPTSSPTTSTQVSGPTSRPSTSPSTIPVTGEPSSGPTKSITTEPTSVTFTVTPNSSAPTTSPRPSTQLPTVPEYLHFVYIGEQNCHSEGYDFGYHMDGCDNSTEIAFNSLPQTDVRNGVDLTTCDLHGMGVLSLLCYDSDKTTNLPTTAMLALSVDAAVMLQGDDDGQLYPNLAAGGLYTFNESYVIRGIEFCFTCKKETLIPSAQDLAAAAANKAVDPKESLEFHSLSFDGVMTCSQHGYDFGMVREYCIPGDNVPLRQLNPTPLRADLGHKCHQTQVIGNLLFNIACSDRDMSSGGLFSKATVTPSFNTSVILQGMESGTIFKNLEGGETYTLENIGKSKAIRAIQFCLSCSP